MSIYKGSNLISGISTNTISNAHFLFEAIWSDHAINNISFLRADQFSYHSGSVYVTAYNELVSEYNNASSTTETEGSITFKRTPKGYKIADTTQETAILNKYNTDGIAWYYILDTTNTQFKLPRTKFGFEGLRTNVGDNIAESLPNLKGWFYVASELRDADGELFKASVYGNRHEYWQSGGSRFDFDASDYSSAYQDNAPVQERATQMYLYFYVGEYAQTAIEQTAGLNAELFNGKLDISTYNNNPRTNAVYLKTCYVNGTSGYNIWSNGYCEQWGFTDAMGDYATATITFVKTFANTNYIIQGNTIWQGTNDDTTWMQAWKIQQNSLKTTGFSFYNRSSTKKVFRWKVCGYLAEGQY